MDNSRIYLKGKEVVTPFYLDETKNEILAKLEEKISEIPVYELPAATTDTLGGIKVGENLEILEDGTLNAKSGRLDFSTALVFENTDHLSESKELLSQYFTDCILNNKDFPVIILNNTNIHYQGIYYLYSKSNSTFEYRTISQIRDRVYDGSDWYFGFKMVINYNTNDNGSITITNLFNDYAPGQQGKFLSTSNTYSYTPAGDYNPATKKYVDDSITSAIAGVSQFSLLPVDTLPTENIKTNVIYAVPSDNPKEQDVRIEYVYINNAWEILGTTKIDLSNYYTKAEINAMFANIANYTPVASAEEAANILNGTAEGSE